MTEEKSQEERTSKRNLITTIVLMVILILFLIFITLFMMDYNAPLPVIILVVAFLFLFFSGLIMKSKEISLIDRLFPKKKIKFDLGTEEEIPRNRDINIEFKYKTPLVKKCPSCGITLPGSMKKCPICGTVLRKY